MKRKIYTTLATLMLAGMFFTVTAPVAEASCSSWTVASYGRWQCRSNRCGFLWANSGTQTRTNTQERWCAENGRQVRRTRTVDETGSCCNV